MRKKEPPGLAGRVLRAAAEWLLTVVLFASVGVVVSSSCYFLIVDELVKTLPAFTGARAGAAGAMLAIALILSRPIGYVTIVYLFGFPIGFALAGHGAGLRIAARYLIAQFGQGLAAECAKLVWPAVVTLSHKTGERSKGAILSSLIRRAAPTGLSRVLLRWTFARAKVPELVGTSRYLDQVKREPEVAQQRLHDAFARFFEGIGNVSRVRLLSLLSIMIVLVTLMSRFWLPWLGVPVEGAALHEVRLLLGRDQVFEGLAAADDLR